jgi:hypothetical protein
MDRMVWIDLAQGSGKGAVEGSCEHSNEPLDSIKCSEILD